MPLVHSKSEPAFKQNVKTLMGEVGKSPHVQSREQALAIAYATKRRGRDMGGSVGSDQALASYLANALSSYGGGVGSAGGGLGTMSTPASSAPAMPTPYPSTAGVSAAPTAPVQAPPGVGMFSTAPVPGPAQVTPAAPANPILGPVLGRQMGGGMPWFARSEARSLMHTGPINSIVPGRTDRHNVNVASGSYVLPASVISHLGQSNTNAGMAVAHRMFGSGPYGGPAMKMGRGMGLPKPPKPMGIPSDRGGARGHDVGKPTPVVVSGGEYIIHPSKVMEIGHGSIEAGHRILDEFVKRIHKKHAKEIAKLPPPAKA